MDSSTPKRYQNFILLVLWRYRSSVLQSQQTLFTILSGNDKDATRVREKVLYCRLLTRNALREKLPYARIIICTSLRGVQFWKSVGPMRTTNMERWICASRQLQQATKSKLQWLLLTTIENRKEKRMIPLLMPRLVEWLVQLLHTAFVPCEALIRLFGQHKPTPHLDQLQ